LKVPRGSARPFERVTIGFGAADVLVTAWGMCGDTRRKGKSLLRRPKGLRRVRENAQEAPVGTVGLGVALEWPVCRERPGENAKILEGRRIEPFASVPVRKKVCAPRG
jgi:hypothetical protein